MGDILREDGGPAERARIVGWGKDGMVIVFRQGQLESATSSAFPQPPHRDARAGLDDRQADMQKANSLIYPP